MKKKQRLRIVLGMITLGALAAPAAAQSARDLPENWHLLDYGKDSVYGTSVNKAYETLLKGKEPHQVIVAVIDSGVDTAHVDLQGHIWTNTGETAGNGVDDDHNGYVDDIHGWNFLGGKDGRSIEKESAELDREYFRLSNKYKNVADSATVAAQDRAEYRYWLNIREKREKDMQENKQNYATVSKGLDRFTEIDSVLRAAAGKDTLYLSDVEGLNTDNDTITVAKAIASRVLSNIGPHSSLEGFIAEGREYADGLRRKMDDVGKDPNALRHDIVGDNPNDINDRDYGNNDIAGKFGRHGTHVAGIISAIRGNNIGMDGIADHVLIMPVRAVPDGDERDKDVALAIRYAVDNGAQIINMSFGKGYSPHKNWVDDAVRYAEEKGVLLVHAAGNDGTNNDSLANYPNPVFADTHKKADNFITVGASSATNDDGHLATSFSNYGKKEVDLFSPGADIYSTVPGNKYEWLSGTSMATPVVVGVAALVLEYYPKLSARQLREVLDKSVMSLQDTSVIQPGGNDEVPFSSLSSSGGIVNAYKALQEADKVKGERKIKKKHKARGRHRRR
ncbi:S8 family serine peptidase [Compostibacter hankyongensis]|uniref:S8 family peptidase n=1 Tax=Compostibacter hankyongensis TaxID=1007089 RepID=A0ABP8FM52_9BACT